MTIKRSQDQHGENLPPRGDPAEQRWTAILLAGQRPGVDPLAEHCGLKYKALVPVNGTPMLLRVARALLGSSKVARIVIIAQEPEALLSGDTACLADEPRIAFAVSNDGIAASIAAVAGTDVAPWPVLVTTADHALLTSAMVDEFLSATGENDITIAVGERKLVEASYPMTKRTWLKFSDGHYSGANLFALRGKNVLPALTLWSAIEQDRKRSWRILSSFGPWLLLRALTRSIAFPDAVSRADGRMQLRVSPVLMTQAEAVIDVDKVADLNLVELILSQRQE